MSSNFLLADRAKLVISSYKLNSKYVQVRVCNSARPDNQFDVTDDPTYDLTLTLNERSSLAVDTGRVSNVTGQTLCGYTHIRNP